MLSEEQVRAAIAEAVDRAGAASIGADTDFEDAGLDSLDHAQILIRIEERYGLHVADADMAECRSIAAILAYSRRPAGDGGEGTAPGGGVAARRA